MFPLSLLPLPGELVPLHIFESRYRQLFREAEETDMTFGIYFTSDLNVLQLGSLMKLESVIKRYPEGESDVITKCVGLFTLNKLYRTLGSKLYPGGDVSLWDLNSTRLPGEEVCKLLEDYFSARNLTQPLTVRTTYEIANELNLDIHDRYKLLALPAQRQELFLSNKLRFLTLLVEQERKSKDVYHLN
jgi:hypothetical protein